MGTGETRRLGRSLATDDSVGAAPCPSPSEARYRAPVENAVAFTDRYVDVAELGRGGMGEVRLCLDTRMEREVALKRIDGGRRELAQRERFLREARIQARLDHPAIVPVYDIGVDDQGLEYFTMKRAQGVTLEEIIDRLASDDPSFCATYTPAVRLGIFRQVLQAVEYAHSRGIVHRDLKPANVIVGGLGETYVLDWGIAKLTDTGGADGKAPPSVGTGRGSALGTPGYLAPEQSYDAERVDGRADVYALGAILFELLALEPLHTGDEVEPLLEAARQGRSEARISLRRPELDVAPELERACVLATRVSPEERLSVAELHATVAGYLEGDRDVALRRDLAQQHAQAAAEAHAAVGRGEDAQGALRSEALRQAGHALALDPQSHTAVDVITHLMAEPPETIPPEAAKMLRKEQRESARSAQRWSVWAYLAFLPLILVGVSLTRVEHWPAVAVISAPLMVAITLAALGTRGLRWRVPPLVGLGCVLVSISASSCLSSPYMIMPALLAAFGTAAIGAAPAATRRPVTWFLMCVVAAAVPMVLQALDLLPVGFSITGNQILIEHRVANASPSVTIGVLVVVTLVTMLAPMAFCYRTAQQLRETQARLLLHVWHLRQLTAAV